MATLKGTAVQPNFDWIKQTYGQVAWDEILEGLTDEQREEISFIQGAKAYDLKLISAVLERLADLRFRGDRQAADRAFRSMGAYIAEVSLSGVYSLFIRVAKPEAILKRIPTIVGTMFDGASAEFFEGDDGKSGSVTISGLQDLAYAGPRLCGWAEEALRRCNAKNVRVTERSWEAGSIRSDELHFDAEWA